MKLLRKALAILLSAITISTFAGCHKKDEVALTIDGVEITSALYMYNLIESDMEAKSKIDTQKASEDTSSDSSSTAVDYYKEKIDGKDFVDYVKEDAINRCKKYARFQKLIDEKVITITDEEKENANLYVENYWYYYGYSTFFEANGVSLETFKKAFLSSTYSDLYFKYTYGEGGKEEVDKETIKKTMNDKYNLVYLLSETYEEKATDADKSALKTKYQGYADRLAKGEDFEKIYEEINGKQEETEDTEGHDHDHEEEDGPKDERASIVGDSDTSYASEDFDAIDALKVGETKLIENSDKSGFIVYKKLDINSDDYYLTALTDDILYVLKSEDFEKKLDNEIKDMKVDENTYATKQFKVKKIVYPEAQ